MFNINKEQAIESSNKVVSNIGAPGIYKMQVVDIYPSTKFKGKDKDDAPTMNITFKVVQVVNVPRKDEAFAKSLIGKLHTDVIDLSLESTSETEDKMFNNKLARVKHILKKAGITPESIDAAIEPALKEMKKQGAWDSVAFVNAIQPLLTDEGKKKVAFGKVLGSVFQGNAQCNFSGYLGFYTEEEPTFIAKERQNINEYYAALDGQVPSSEGAPSNGGNTGGSAF